MSNLKPNKSTSPSQNLDKKSVRLVKDLLEDHHVEDSQLEEGGTLANIDGYIELLDEEDRIEAKVTVQVKHLTNSPLGADAFYDIPQSLFGYADRMKGELVLFIACDTDNKTFYWKHIDKEFIATFPSTPTHVQKTLRYHFRDNEACNSNNVDATLKEWRKLFNLMIDSIKDEKKNAEHFVQIHRIPFLKISKVFSGVEHSYICRSEVNSVLNWVKNSLGEQESNLCLISGNAGVGKSVIIKDVIDNLDLLGLTSLCIKADSINFLSEKLTLDQILDAIHFLKSDQDKVVVIIDQIDALSQYLTNDRNNVNLLVSLINALSSEKDVRVIVSCRKFDLEYDEEIKSVCSNAKVFEIGLLSDEDVKSVTDSLQPKLYDKLDARTKELLQTAQFLDTFCRICAVTKERCNFSSITDLYDSYWQLLTSPIGKIASVEIENLLYELSSLMLKCETLSPCWTPKGEIQQIADCLASRGAIIEVNHQVSFFHQSFYDYVLARSIVSEGVNFVEQIESKFQGFEMRSTIKAVIEYVRDHGTAEYLNVLRGLLFSSQIRKHIKYLVLSLIAFIQNPQKEEKRIIKELCQTDENLLSYFLRAINNDMWFTTLKSIVIPHISTLSIKDEICYPIANFLSASSFKNPKLVFGLIDTINIEETKEYLLSIVLRGHNDYSEECVIQAFSTYYCNSRNTLFLVSSLQDSISTNKPFALKKAEEILYTYLDNPDEFDKNSSSYELVDVFCKKLSTEYPEDFLLIMNDLFLDIVKRKSTSTYYGLCTNTVFNKHMDDYVEKLYLMYKTNFISSSLKQKNKQRILDLINTNDECAICLALETISIMPFTYTDIVEEWLLFPDVIDKLLLADTEYYVLQVLKKWFITQSKEKQREYEILVLNYVSKNDLYADKSRLFGLLYPYLWHNKWKLICETIPKELSSSDVIRCRQELIRRFKNPYIAKKPNHRVGMARACGGVTSRDNYVRFSPKQWLHSFLYLKDRWVGERTPVDYRVHASMFEECVSLRPHRFITLVADIINNDDIRKDYKIAGILGLLRGKIDIEEIWSLARGFVTVDFANNNCHDFGKIIEYYIQTPNSYLNEITELLLNVVDLPCDLKNIYTPKLGNNELSQEVNEHLTRALNSPQGKAIELLLKMCSIPSKKSLVYNYLKEHRNSLSIDIKVLVLYYIFTKDCYDENLTTDLFLKFITDVGSIGLCINVQIIQRYMYHNPEIIRDYLESIEENTITHELLSQIYFYGLAVSAVHYECKNKLEKILDLNNERVIAAIVRASMHTYSDSEYHNYSKYYLERYATDERESVVHSYCIHCNSLSTNDFNFFMDIFGSIKASKYIDLSDVLDYIKKVANYYPVECYKFVKDKLLHSYNSNLLHTEIMEIIHIIYKRLSEEDDSDNLNELMEIFETDLYMSARVVI